MRWILSEPSFGPRISADLGAELPVLSISEANGGLEPVLHPTGRMIPDWRTRGGAGTVPEA